MHGTRRPARIRRLRKPGSLSPSRAGPSHSIVSCARSRRASGTGKHRTQTGQGPRTRRFASAPPRRRTRPHAGSFPRTRSGTMSMCCCSTRWPCHVRSRSSLPGAIGWSCSTCPWHERDTRNLVERLGVPVFTPRPDEGSPDVAWLLGGDRGDAHLFAAGERLSVGVEALPGRLPNDVVLWVESRRAVIAGDTLVDFGQGLEIPVEWLPAGVTREQARHEGLRARYSSSRSSRARDPRWAHRRDRPRIARSPRQMMPQGRSDRICVTERSPA